MANFVAHCEKYKISDIGRIGKHEKRENLNYSNKDIDSQRKALNFNVLEVGYTGNYSARIHQAFEKFGLKKWDAASRTGVRSDSVVLADWVIGASAEFFDGMGKEDIKKYFSYCVNWFVKKIGEGRVINAVVHMDEQTPHLHFSYVPIIENKEKGGYKLSCKDLHSRQFLRAVQNELPKQLQYMGFEIERGIEGSKAKHITPQKYKQLQSEIQAEVKPTIEALKGLEAGERGTSGLINRTPVVKISPAVRNQAIICLENYENILQENLKLKQRLTNQQKLIDDKKKARDKVTEANERNGELLDQIKQLTEERDSYRDLYAEALEQNTQAYKKGLSVGKDEAMQSLEAAFAFSEELKKKAEKEAQEIRAFTEAKKKEAEQAAAAIIENTKRASQNILAKANAKMMEANALIHDMKLIGRVASNLRRCDHRELQRWYDMGVAKCNELDQGRTL